MSGPADAERPSSESVDAMRARAALQRQSFELLRNRVIGTNVAMLNVAERIASGGSTLLLLISLAIFAARRQSWAPTWGALVARGVGVFFLASALTMLSRAKGERDAALLAWGRHFARLPLEIVGRNVESVAIVNALWVSLWMLQVPSVILQSESILAVVLSAAVGSLLPLQTMWLARSRWRRDSERLGAELDEIGQKQLRDDGWLRTALLDEFTARAKLSGSWEAALAAIESDVQWAAAKAAQASERDVAAPARDAPARDAAPSLDAPASASDAA
jgi:hypothetical protein